MIDKVMKSAEGIILNNLVGLAIYADASSKDDAGQLMHTLIVFIRGAHSARPKYPSVILQSALVDASPVSS